MATSVISPGPAVAVAVALLAVLGAVVAGLGRLGHGWAVARAAARAVLQLGVVALVVAGVVRSWPLTGLFLLLMAATASRTAGRRATASRTGWWLALAVVPAPVAVVVVLVSARVVPAVGIAVIPVTGILLGGAMAASGLAGRRALDELGARRGEHEAALSLGLPVRDAALLICREAAADALVPALDQTRTVGLVTLPGAFVGVLLGGASPLDAAVVQLVVLVALLAVEAVAILVVTEVVARGVVLRPALPG